jgi:hypothetical protein
MVGLLIAVSVVTQMDHLNLVLKSRSLIANFVGVVVLNRFVIKMQYVIREKKLILVLIAFLAMMTREKAMRLFVREEPAPTSTLILRADGAMVLVMLMSMIYR